MTPLCETLYYFIGLIGFCLFCYSIELCNQPVEDEDKKEDETGVTETAGDAGIYTYKSYAYSKAYGSIYEGYKYDMR